MQSLQQSGDPNAMLFLIHAYRYGMVIEPDQKQVEYWCNKWINQLLQLAQKNDVEAIKTLYNVYTGMIDCIEPDPIQASLWKNQLSKITQQN